MDQFLAEQRAKELKEVTLGVYVAEAATGKELYSGNGESLLIPASVLKIITSLAALKSLGAAYRFPTEVFVDSLPVENDPRLDTSLGMDERRQKAWTAGNLYVRGYGDPSLLSEQLTEIAGAVYARGVREVNHLVIDDTLFRNPPQAGGPRPYQAALSATSLNSNCYTVTVAPSGPGAPAFVSLTAGAPFTVRSQVRSRAGDELNLQISQIPFSSSFTPGVNQEKIDRFASLESTRVLIDARGVIGTSSPAEVRYFTVPDPAAYFGAVFKGALERAGTVVKGKAVRGETPAGAKQVLLYESKSLAEILRDLNHYSSNYLAGQIVYAMGQDGEGYFRHEKGLERLNVLLQSLGYESGQFKIADGSGLSRDNRISAQQLVKTLVAGYRDFSVAPDLLASLSRFGQTGTLKKRQLLDEKEFAAVPTTLYKQEKQLADGVWGKTGTLDGVSSVAGYLENRSGDRYAFAVIMNHTGAKPVVRDIEDEIVKILIRTE